MNEFEFISSVYDGIEKHGIKRYNDVSLNPLRSKGILEVKIYGKITRIDCNYTRNELDNIVKIIQNKASLIAIENEFC